MTEMSHGRHTSLILVRTTSRDVEAELMRRIAGVYALGSFPLKPFNMTKNMKDHIRGLLRQSEDAKVDIVVRQICNNKQGLLEFDVKVGTAKSKSIGSYKLSYYQATI